MSTRAFEIRMSSESRPSVCRVMVEAPSNAADSIWNPGLRERADTLARQVLSPGRGEDLQFKEDGLMRFYRVPQRNHDGWAAVPSHVSVRTTVESTD